MHPAVLGKFQIMRLARLFEICAHAVQGVCDTGLFIVDVSAGTLNTTTALRRCILTSSLLYFDLRSHHS